MDIINLWSIVHILLYILIGLVLPNKWLLIILFSLIWEIYEYIMSRLTNDKYYNESFINRILDIIFNLIGYYIGNLLIKIDSGLDFFKEIQTFPINFIKR